jgi:N-glycosylase/DNA lyase
MKHYGFRGVSGTKQAMSPRLYDAISEIFYNVWGDYAGWAHSVRLSPNGRYNVDACLQVLFTADLKAFSHYGLFTPTSSPSKRDVAASQAEGDYFSAPIHSSRKRGVKKVRTHDTSERGDIVRVDHSAVEEASSLAERVKKRRRISQTFR